jgi:hypothetical protein
MATYHMELNKDETGFVCDTQENTEKAIKNYKRWGNKAKMDILNPVSQDFRGYYFKGIIGIIHRIKMYPNLSKFDIKHKFSTGLDLTDVYHELLKQKFNGIDVKNWSGEIETIGMSVAVRDTGKFFDYIERINAYTSENFSIKLPTPEEYKAYERNAEIGDPEFNDWYVENNT